MLYSILPSKEKSNVNGLKWLPSIPGKNDRDNIPEVHKGKSVSVEFSERDQKILLEKFLSIKDQCRCIVEIGIHRNSYEKTSTSILIDNKLDNTVYMGIDIEDKSFLDNPSKNVYTIKTDSKDREKVYRKLEKLGISEIDFLFIDGWHSINAVINDWQYSEKLSKFGIIGFHDTNYHPGPYFVFEAIDENLFTKEKYFEGLIDDWGISFARKI